MGIEQDGLCRLSKRSQKELLFISFEQNTWCSAVNCLSSTARECLTTVSAACVHHRVKTEATVKRAKFVGIFRMIGNVAMIFNCSPRPSNGSLTFSISSVIVRHTRRIPSVHSAWPVLESSCRYRLSILNEKLTALERHVDYLEARVMLASSSVLCHVDLCRRR